MTAPGWLAASQSEVPAGDSWLSPRERAVQAGLRFAKRREDWRLGRRTAKAAAGAWLGVPASRVEILAAPDGAPEAWVDGGRAPVSISLSHRAGRSLAVVADAPAVVGCDLELVEHRSEPFVREWLAPAEQALLGGLGADERDRLANLLWAAKEAAAKVLREGLRVDVRRAAVELSTIGAGGGWQALQVGWPEGEPIAGWWRSEPGWVLVVAGAPATGPPRRLRAAAGDGS